MIKLLECEIGHQMGYAALRLIDLHTDAGRLRALCFYADPPEVADIPEIPIDQVTSTLAHACGHIGSGAEYLFKTVAALQAADIHDPHLWQLQDLVAAEIKKLQCSKLG